MRRLLYHSGSCYVFCISDNGKDYQNKYCICNSESRTIFRSQFSSIEISIIFLFPSKSCRTITYHFSNYFPLTRTINHHQYESVNTLHHLFMTHQRPPPAATAAAAAAAIACYMYVRMYVSQPNF